MENIIKDYLYTIQISNTQSHKNLSVFPLLSDYVVPFDYLTLDEALSKNLIEVVELDKDGSVPELKVVNKSDRMVLILDGEELVGAKQNRIVNTTILIPAKSTTVIPVSCVEQGRWSYDTDKFYSLKRVMSPKMRAGKSDQVRYSLKNANSFRSDQSAIWNEISSKAMRLDAESPSMAMSEIYEKEASGIQDYVKHFELIESQIGAVFMINGKVVGMDCFGKADTFASVFKKLVESYALDAIDAGKSKKEHRPKKKDAKQFLASSAACRIEPHASVGLGTDCRLESNSATGFALVNDDQILHLSVFARGNGNTNVQSRSGMQRFSLRRRFRR
jgi:hypothetical protein